MESVRRKKNLIETYGMILIDAVAIFLAYALGVGIRLMASTDKINKTENIVALAVAIVLGLLYLMLFDESGAIFKRGKFEEFKHCFKYTLFIVAGLVVVLFLTGLIKQYSRMIFILFAIFDFIFTYDFHLLFKKYMLSAYKRSNSSAKMLVITNSVMAGDVIYRLMNDAAYDYEVVGAVIYDKNRNEISVDGVEVVADRNNLYETVIQMRVDEVFICLPNVDTIEIRDMVQRFEEMGLTTHVNVDLFSRHCLNNSVQKIANYSCISFEKTSMDARKLVVKRMVDIIGALVGCILTCIITPFVAAAIKIESPGPVFFSQTRIGKNGRRFKIYKFRSMYIDAEERKKALMAQNEMNGLMFKMENDPRITKVGNFIRKTSIDETPQFFNILLGDMSLIGTRPPTVDEFEQYSGYYRRRLSITPGLTGMWQVSGRSEIQDFDEIVALDLKYIDNWTLGLDLKILFMTFYTVLARKGSK